MVHQSASAQPGAVLADLLSLEGWTRISALPCSRRSKCAIVRLVALMQINGPAPK